MKPWIFLTLVSGVFNALWTSRVKGRVSPKEAASFAAAMRIGVSLFLLLPAVMLWRDVSGKWWLYSAFAGSTEVLSLWMFTRGAQKDYYAAYAYQNTTPIFVALGAPVLLGESLSLGTAAGTALVVLGALWLFSRGHFSLWGLCAALVGSASGFFSKAALQEGGGLQHACVAFGLGGVFLWLWRAFRDDTAAENLVGALRRFLGLIALSACATACFYTALETGPLSSISPLVRVNLAVGYILSYFQLQERQDPAGRFFGGALLIAGLVLVGLSAP